jgi:Ca2+-binding RTX toxin-like protein
MMGLDGDDFYVIDDAEDIVTESEFEGIDEVRTSIALTEAIAEVENYTFTGSKAVSFTGSYWANKITGTAGNDSLRGDTPDGGSYGDTLNGGAGADTMAGGLSDDTYVVDNVKDVILDTGGWDRVISSISFTLREDLIAFEGLEELFLTGSAALTGMGRDAQFSGDLIIGNAGANKLFGLSGNDTLDGGAGNDTLDGGFGVDAMTGGAGNDVYIVDDALDTVSDSAGIDTVLSSVSLSFLTVSGVENIKLTGSDDIDCFVGVTVTGNDGNNELSASKMIGGGGDDVYWVGNGSVVVESQAGEKGGIDTVRWMGLGDYTLAANVENLVTGANATGNGLNNRIDGTAGGANHFDGAAGNDTIIGGAGDDTITVSLGNDRVVWGFEFDFLDGHDLIVGFDGNPLDGQDVFDLDLIFDNWAVPTNDRASSVSIVDNGATVDVYYGDTVAATLQTTDEITIGEDVSLGTL